MKKIIVLLTVFFPQILFSQLVNIEKERKTYSPGFQGASSFSFKITENTSRIIQGNNTTNLQFITKNMRNTFLVLNDYTVMKVRKDKNNYDLINKNFQHFRYNYILNDTNSSNFGKITYEVFFQRQQNKIKYINMRLLWGSGFRFRVIKSNNITLYLSPLAMYEYEQLTDSAQTITKQIKGDFYTSIKIQLTEQIQFTNVTYYQPSFFDLGKSTNFEPIKDFRLSSENSLTFNIFKDLIKFSITFKMSYDSRPPVELIDKPLFYTLKNEITINF